MNGQLNKSAGISLIIGAILVIITMVLHPVGGGIKHLLEISTILIATHALAIISLPFLLYGFWGLSDRLGITNSISLVALITISMGIIAGMLAAAINGLALPMFIENYIDADTETLNSIEPILKYGLALNMAMDYIFIGACCIAILLWGILIVTKLIFPKWIGYAGILLSICAIVTGISGFVFTDLFGFRVFIFGLVLWIVVVGYYLRKRLV
jgi:hypothetical protein